MVVPSGQDQQNLVAAFIEAAVSDLRRAEEILDAHPGIAEGGYYAWLVLGDWRRVEQTLKEIPPLATAPGGSKNWEPLLYVCFSRFAAGTSARAADFAETARVLLRYGASPDTAYIPEDLPDNPLSCLYAATGLNNNILLGEVLLEAGANPNDSESLYHSTEHSDLAAVRLLLRYGAKIPRSNALKHMLDREDMEGLRLLLAAGADPNELNDRGETALHWAVWRGRSISAIEAVLASGAQIDAQRNDGRTAYALAFQSGQTDVARWLAAHGAETALSPLDRFSGECAVAGPEEMARLLASHSNILDLPGGERLLPDLAMGHRTPAVRGLLAAGASVNARGEAGATGLHWACWKGYADVVELFLSYGASLTIEDEQFHGTPGGWFGHGVRNCQEGGGDYPRVARLLISAGATIPKADLPTGNREVDAVLREYGLI